MVFMKMKRLYLRVRNRRRYNIERVIYGSALHDILRTRKITLKQYYAMCEEHKNVKEVFTFLALCGRNFPNISTQSDIKKAWKDYTERYMGIHDISETEIRYCYDELHFFTEFLNAILRGCVISNEYWGIISDDGCEFPLVDWLYQLPPHVSSRLYDVVIVTHPKESVFRYNVEHNFRDRKIGFRKKRDVGIFL